MTKTKPKPKKRSVKPGSVAKRYDMAVKVAAVAEVLAGTTPRSTIIQAVGCSRQSLRSWMKDERVLAAVAEQEMMQSSINPREVSPQASVDISLSKPKFYERVMFALGGFAVGVAAGAIIQSIGA